jgi:ATPase subunit of ABC transporter with duplicated ATPase domains
MIICSVNHIAKLLILDEPTNHLDIDSCEVLEEALDELNGTILAVSHDRYFLNKLFNKIYWLQDGSVHYFAGNFDWAKGKLALINGGFSLMLSFNMFMQFSLFFQKNLL